ncbi:MAG: GIY-YIG nuclease family protein [Gemmatimonadaceae bacterium]|nr:GIY-YIG nuclease family protein [Gemmatimonadaceae bacterium]
MRALSKVKLLTPLSGDAQVAEMRAHVRATATDRPGVYRMLSASGEIVYVGKAKKVRTRLLSYFRCVYPGDKGARIVREAVKIEWEYMPSEFAALLEELRLIKRFRPRMNVAMKRDARHFAFIKLTRGTAPKLLVVRGAGADDAQIYYGPFHGAQAVGEAVRELNDALGLRDCRLDQPMHFADQPELFHTFPRTPGCIRHEIRKCLGPCVGGCTAQEYNQRVDLVRSFLDGADDGPMDLLRADMEAASAAMEFERAGTLRDKLYRLEGLREQFVKFRFAIETLSFVYVVPGHEGDDRIYLIRRGRVRGEATRPRTHGERAALLEMVEGIFNPAERESAQLPSHEVDELLLLSSWFRRFPAELTRAQQAAAFAAAPPALAYDAASDALFGSAAVPAA